MKEKSIEKPSHNPRFFEYLKLLANRVQYLRRRNNETMEELANSCGVTRGTIHKLEHPTVNEDISMATVWGVSQHFSQELDQLLAGLDKATSSNSASKFSEKQTLWLEEEDYIAFSLVSEVASLQFRADLAEQACLVAKDENQLEVLALHSAKLRQRRYSLLLKQRENS